MARILVVDDDQLLRDLLESMLVALGQHEIHLTQDVAGALTLIRSVDMDVAIVDYKLGGETNGVVLAKAMLRINENLKIILMSGLVIDATDTGGYPFLQKPFLQHDLEAMLARG